MSAIRLERAGMPSPNNLQYEMINHFVLDPESCAHMEKYYLLSWTPSYFFNELSDGTITHQGVRYLVVYHDKLFEIRASAQIRLSFRKVKQDIGYNIPAYVIVKKGT